MAKKKIEYNSRGELKFNPAFHSNNHKKWNQEDLEYLIGWYDIIGKREMSFALERTENTIAQKVTALRKQGRMPQIKDFSRRYMWNEC